MGHVGQTRGLPYADDWYLERKMGEEGIHEGCGTEANHVGNWQAGFVFGEFEGVMRLIVVEAGRDEGEADHTTGAFGANPTHGFLVHSDHAVERGEQALFVVLDGGSASAVGEDHGVGDRAVQQTEGYGRVAWVVERTLALYENPIMLSGRIEYHFFDQARGKIANQAIDGEAIIGNHDTGLASGQEGTVKPTFARLAIEFEGCGHLACGAIAADEHDRVAARAMWCEVGDALFGRGAAHIPDGYITASRGGAKFFIVREEDVQAADDIEASVDSGENLTTPGIGQVAAAVGDANEQSVRLVGEGGVDIGHDRNALAKWFVQGVGHILTGGLAIDNGNDGILAVADHAGGGFAVVPVERAFG
jgi:hypothetical protein